MNEEIVNFVKERGLLVGKDVLDLLNNLNDFSLAKNFLDEIEKVSGQKMITGSTITKNFKFVKQIVNSFPNEAQNSVEKIFINFGVSLEIKKETETRKNKEQDYQIFYATNNNENKKTVQDFVGHFRSRYQQIQRILMQRPNLGNLTSINKITSNRQNLTIIGIVTEKRVTKNKNLIIKFEDLTGEINAMVKFGSENFSSANELQFDDVVAIKASGNNEILYIHEIIYPDAYLPTKTNFDEDMSIAFVSDIHVGSKKHLSEEFENFLVWINGDNEVAKKIKYIFFVGDNVDGVGVFPGQEKLLNLTSLKGQYDKLAEYLKKIPKHITLFMCPGQHDSSRIAEPQPVIDKKYGASLHELENLILVSNPSLIKLKEGEKEFKVLMYHGASIHTFINEIEELRLAKAHQCPARAVKHMLKRRHLAPMHGVSTSVVYVPNAEKDPLVISEVPNVLCTGEVHRLDIERYNGILIITGSCWQAQTDFEEKVGNIPDPCKVPILNLKTNELKIFDFSKEENEN